MLNLKFDKDRHIYKLNGKIVPGITEILRAAGLADVHAIPEQYRVRGLAVHAWTEVLDRNKKSKLKIPNVVLPYVEAWQKFCSDTNLRILAIEELVCDRLQRFATRIDRRVQMNGYEWILNLKTGAMYDFYSIQSAMEAMCYRHGLRRASVFLSKDGKYKLAEYTDPRDFKIAEKAIQIYYRRRLT